MRLLRSLLLLLALCGGPLPAAALERPQILILSAGDSLLPAGRIMADEIHRGLEAGLGQEVDTFVEFLDAIRFPNPDDQALTSQLIEAKHGGKRFDLIFALGPPAYAFVAARRPKDYLQAPVVFLAMRESTIAEAPALPDATGIVSRFDLQETVRLAKRLQPDLQKLYVVTGSSPFDRSWDSVARRELADAFEDVAIGYLADLPMDELTKQLGALPSRSALLYLTMFEDASGQAFMAPDIAGKLAKAAPVYSVYSTYLDRGIVGGYMDTFDAIGRAGAALGLRILKGEPASSIPPGPVEPQTYVVDWPTLEKWGLDAARLPSSALVLNRPPSLWGEYREQITVVAVLVLMQTLLIVALLTQNRRRQLAEGRLKESEDRMRLAASSANLGLWRWDSRSGKVWMTDHCRKILDLPDDSEATIDRLLATVHRDDRTALRRQIEQSARWDRPFDAECRIVLPGGGIRWLSIKGQSTKSGHDPADQVTGVVVDVSDRKEEQVEAERQRTQLTHLTRVAILGELSGAMAHELNQPLAAILSNAQAGQRLLERQPPDLEETRAIMADIVADDLRAGEVIQRLRSLLKRGESKQEPLDVNVLVAEVLDLAHSELVTQQVSLETALSADLPAVLGDRIQLQQVLLNLVINACEAMREIPPARRVLSVSSEVRQGREVELTVADSGPGVPPAQIDQIFEPFSTTKREGLGLGLSISRAIVAAHNGHLRVRNGADGGAVFAIRLPAAA